MRCGDASTIDLDEPRLLAVDFHNHGFACERVGDKDALLMQKRDALAAMAEALDDETLRANHPSPSSHFSPLAGRRGGRRNANSPSPRLRGEVG